MGLTPSPGYKAFDSHLASQDTIPGQVTQDKPIRALPGLLLELLVKKNYVFTKISFVRMV